MALAVAGVLGGLLAFELAVQAVAYVLWLNGGVQVEHAGDKGTTPILCIGDSNTYGVGASEPSMSYPAMLQRALDESPGGCRVINAGWPGNNSRDVLLALPGLLERHRPRLVCVLVGVNDIWSTPEPVTDAELRQPPPAGFPLRWRTGRLFALAVSWLRGDREPERVPPFIGSWHEPETGFSVQITADGRVVIDGDTMWWKQRGSKLDVVSARGAGTTIGWKRAGDHLVLEVLDDRHELLPGAGAGGGSGGGHGSLFVAPQKGPDLEGAERDAAFEEACRVIEASPADSAVWQRLAGLRLERPQWQRLETILRRAIAADPAPAARAALLRGLCLLPHVPQADKLHYVLQAGADDGRVGPVVEFLKRARPRFERPAFEAAVARVEADAATRAVLLSAFDTAHGVGRGYAVVLERHLRRIVELCRAAGATPLLLGYPRPKHEIDAVLQRVCTGLKVQQVELQSAFEARLRADPGARLFAPDGHCNDAGYEILTGRVVEAVRARLESGGR